jgi:hypothetical protein
MKVEKKLLHNTIRDYLIEADIEGIGSGETTQKIMKLIKPLILAAEAIDADHLQDELNRLHFKEQLKIFHNYLKNLQRTFKPDPDSHFKAGFTINPKRALKHLADNHKMSREEALLSFLQDPIGYGAEILHILGEIHYLMHEKIRTR